MLSSPRDACKRSNLCCKNPRWNYQGRAKTSFLYHLLNMSGSNIIIVIVYKLTKNSNESGKGTLLPLWASNLLHMCFAQKIPFKNWRKVVASAKLQLAWCASVNSTNSSKLFQAFQLSNHPSNFGVQGGDLWNKTKMLQLRNFRANGFQQCKLTTF